MRKPKPQHRWRCLGYNEDGRRCGHRLRPGTFRNQNGRCRAHKDQTARAMEPLIDPLLEETRARLDPGPPTELLNAIGIHLS